jgi:hypothetical protein
MSEIEFKFFDLQIRQPILFYLITWFMKFFILFIDQTDQTSLAEPAGCVKTT